MTAAAGAATEMASVVAQVEKQLAELRVRHAAGTRTSVMTHVAWAPPQWAAAARRTLAGLDELHPSRTILLFPDARKRDGIGVRVDLKCFTIPDSEREVCSEVIELRLGGRKRLVPGSIVEPLLITDLPTFCRWRGLPPWGKPELEQLVDVCDRLVVDSSEWRGLPAAYRKLEALLDRIAVSDVAWGRSLAWRGRLASLWPDVAQAKTLSVTGPKADALLLVGWLRSRLRKRIRLTHRPASQIERVAVDGKPVPPPRGPLLTPSDLLSAQLDVFGRDRVYEDAIRATGR